MLLFFHIGKAAMNATRYWKGREDVCAVVTSSNIPYFSLPYSAVNLFAPLAITVGRFPIANNCTRWCYHFKSLSQDGGRADFSKRFHARLTLSTETPFSQIHLVEQYL